MSAESLNYWVDVFGEEYAPTLVFELSNGRLGLAWRMLEKEVGGVAYAEFVLATIVEPGGKIQHFRTYMSPKDMIKRTEPYRWKRESVLTDLFNRLKGLLGG